MKEIVSTGICTRCQQKLVQDADILRCPVCGSHVVLSTYHAALRLNVPFRGSGSPRPAASPRQPKTFTELWNNLYPRRR